MYFTYDDTEIHYLKSKDKRMKNAIEQIGKIERKVDANLFTAVIRHIIGQQISNKAQRTIWQRFCDNYTSINAQQISQTSIEELYKLGISNRKANYILDFAHKVQNKDFDLNAIYTMNDDDAIATLSSLNGIGTWTAEMILLFCLQRKNIFSFKDLAILRGLRMLYRHKTIDKTRFEKYRQRFSPYASVASLYLWEIAGGKIPELNDPAM